MCELCDKVVEIAAFSSTEQYMECLDCIKILIKKNCLVPMGQTCGFDDVKNENDTWFSDIIEHKLKCTECGEKFVCFCDTYHGNGSFKQL